MERQRGWVLWLLFAVACGGKSHVDAPSTGNAGAGNAGAGNAARCPDNSAEPSEGDACKTPGVACSGYGALSCPLTAVCGADSKWQIHCSSDMLFGPCTCAHPEPGRAPDQHRTTAIGCSHTRAPSLTTTDAGASPPEGECSQDSDCVDAALGDNGRCVQIGPIPGNTCNYDTCFADSACAKGSVCECREPPDGIDANYCTAPSNCHVDADCGDHGYCSPSQAHEWCNAFYACHTPNDECVDDSDCGSDTHCDFDTNAKHWVCGNLCGPTPP